MKPGNYQSLMRDMLDDELYSHSLGVAEAAVSLAERYGADQEKAYLAGIVHDYGKRYSVRQLREKARQLKLSLDQVVSREGRLLHAPVGSALLRTELALDDKDVLRAVALHTTGRRGMSILEKVLYLADYIEVGRDFEGVEEIRRLSRQNLEGALLVAVENTIRSVLNRGLLLHPHSVVFRNELVDVVRNQ